MALWAFTKPLIYYPSKDKLQEIEVEDHLSGVPMVNIPINKIFFCGGAVGRAMMKSAYTYDI